MAEIDLQNQEGRNEALRRMLTIRAFDEAPGEHLPDGHIPGLAHLYIGEEAVAVGACGALQPDDYIASTHRGQGTASPKVLIRK